MEELKLLVDMVAHLPSMALWVIAFFFIYKVSIIGSIYGVIRLGIMKAHDWLTNPKPRTVIQKIDVAGECITGAHTDLLRQIRRCKRATGQYYIHDSDVAWLTEAIDAKIEADKITEAAKKAERAEADRAFAARMQALAANAR